MAVGRGGAARDAHRRRGFMMEEVDDGQDDPFITTDLAVRSALFNG